MLSERESLPLIVAATDDFLYAASTALHSITVNLARSKRLHVFMFGDGLDPERRARFVRFCEVDLGIDLEMVGLADLSPRAQEAMAEVRRALPQRTNAQNARFAVPELLAGRYHRAVYLDVDVVALGDISPLWAVDLHGWTVGAVEGPTVRPGPRAEVQRYFNSGALVLDVERWVEDDVGFAVLDRMVKNAPYTRFDQDSINVVLSGPDREPHWQPLDPVWNYLGEPDPRVKLLYELPDLADVRIAHFAGQHDESWSLAGNPLMEAFQRHASVVPFEAPRPSRVATTRRRFRRVVGRLRRALGLGPGRATRIPD